MDEKIYTSKRGVAVLALRQKKSFLKWEQLRSDCWLTNGELAKECPYLERTTVYHIHPRNVLFYKLSARLIPKMPTEQFTQQRKISDGTFRTDSDKMAIIYFPTLLLIWDLNILHGTRHKNINTANFKT